MCLWTHEKKTFFSSLAPTRSGGVSQGRAFLARRVSGRSAFTDAGAEGTSTAAQGFLLASQRLVFQDDFGRVLGYRHFTLPHLRNQVVVVLLDVKRDRARCRSCT